MAEFLTTADISARLQKIIREADERLVLISPYLKVNPRIRELLEQKSRTETHVRIIYGKRELPPEERKWIDSVPAIELCFRQSLHAKCYLNEKEAILTSMNLYQFSEQNNDEMGIVVTNNLWDDKDRALYNKISAQAEEIAYFSQKIREVPRSGQAQGLVGRLRKTGRRPGPRPSKDGRVAQLGVQDAMYPLPGAIAPQMALTIASQQLPFSVAEVAGIGWSQPLITNLFRHPLRKIAKDVFSKLGRPRLAEKPRQRTKAASTQKNPKIVKRTSFKHDPSGHNQIRRSQAHHKYRLPDFVSAAKLKYQPTRCNLTVIATFGYGNGSKRTIIQRIIVTFAGVRLRRVGASLCVGTAIRATKKFSRLR